MQIVIAAICLLLSLPTLAASKIVNIYTWATDIPDFVIQGFEKETGIHVNHMSYDSNEVLIAKLRSSHEMQFDIIEPSSFFLELMTKEKLLLPLTIKEFPEVKQLQKRFIPQNNTFQYIPYFFGITGILVNDKFHNPMKVQYWRDLWSKKYINRLLLLNEQREVFSIALLALGLDPNTEDPKKIQAAYQALIDLFPNIKLFNSDAQMTLFIDEDVTLGMMWNVDAVKAHSENPHLKFIFPKDGYVMYNDGFAITRHAPHRENAMKFLHYLLRSDVAAKISMELNYAVTLRSAIEKLPKEIRENKIIYPNDSTLQKATLQKGISEKTIQHYGKLWEKLKLRY